jgi:hypothetical protein
MKRTYPLPYISCIEGSQPCTPSDCIIRRHNVYMNDSTAAREFEEEPSKMNCKNRGRRSVLVDWLARREIGSQESSIGQL